MNEPFPTSSFIDIHVSFGRSESPPCRRLGRDWTRNGAANVPVWIAHSASERGSQPLVSEAPGWRLWANGPVFAYRGDDTEPLNRFATDLAVNRADPSHLDMHAVIFGWHEPSRQLSVWTDRMGTIHAYVGSRPNRAAVGTFFGAVAEQSSREVDWLGITGFCGFGFYPGNRTMFSDIRILRPATHTVFDHEGRILSQSRYWNWGHDPDRSRGVDDFVDEFHDVWTRTIHRHLRGTRSVIPLSGGLDSRTVFAAAAPLTQAGPSPARTLTYGYDQKSIEMRISRRVAAARGHSALELTVRPYLLDRLPEILDAVEGFQGLAFSRQVGASNEIAGLGDHVVGGHWGDVWFDTAGAPNGGSSDLAAVAYDKFVKRGREWLLDNLCAPHLDQPPDAVLRQILVEELDRIPTIDDPDMRLKAFKTEQWSFRWTLASVRTYQLAASTVMPFYANEVVEFFLRVPSEQLPRRQMQTAYLCRHHPDLARLPWQETGMSLFEHSWEPPLVLGRRAIAKATRTLRRVRPIERNWEVQYLGSDRPERVRELLHRTLSTTVIPPRMTEEFVDEFLEDPNASRGYTLDALVTLASIGEPLRAG